MCFGLEWIKDVIIWIIVICAALALFKLLIGFILPKVGLAAETLGFIVQAVTIVFWAVICIAAVVFIFDIVMCLMPSLPRLR